MGRAQTVLYIDHLLQGGRSTRKGWSQRIEEAERGCPQPTPAYPDADCGQNHHRIGINGGARHVGLIEGLPQAHLQRVRRRLLLEALLRRVGWLQSLAARAWPP